MRRPALSPADLNFLAGYLTEADEWRLTRAGPHPADVWAVILRGWAELAVCQAGRWMPVRGCG